MRAPSHAPRPTPRHATRLFAAVAIVVLALSSAAVIAASADASSRDAARLVEQMRDAAANQDFTATVEVTWRNTSGERKQARVDVRGAGGVIEVSSGDQTVLGERGHTFVQDDQGWWAPAKEPRAGRRPSPDDQWALALEHGSSLGRDTTTVVASRADGSVAQRLVVDDATKVLVARQVLARDGAVERGFRFTTFSVTPTSAVARGIATPSSTVAKDAAALGDVPDEFAAPESIGGGYRLVSKSRHGDGVQLAYSDGLFTVSVLEQAGELDWAALPANGSTVTVDGARARRYSQPLGEVVIWERDGVVFTCVSDAPRDVSRAALSGISSGPGLVDRVVAFVLDPFSFD